MTHRLTMAFATLLHGKPLDYERTALAIEGVTDGMPDEQKADLYALIQDSVTPGMPFEQLVDTLDRCLTSNERHFG